MGTDWRSRWARPPGRGHLASGLSWSPGQRGVVAPAGLAGRVSSHAPTAAPATTTAAAGRTRRLRARAREMRDRAAGERLRAIAELMGGYDSGRAGRRSRSSWQRILACGAVARHGLTPTSVVGLGLPGRTGGVFRPAAFPHVDVQAFPCRHALDLVRDDEAGERYPAADTGFPGAAEGKTLDSVRGNEPVPYRRKPVRGFSGPSRPAMTMASRETAGGTRGRVMQPLTSNDPPEIGGYRLRGRRAPGDGTGLHGLDPGRPAGRAQGGQARAQ